MVTTIKQILFCVDDFAKTGLSWDTKEEWLMIINKKDIASWRYLLIETLRQALIQQEFKSDEIEKILIKERKKLDEYKQYFQEFNTAA